MSQRTLLAVGILAVAASVLMGAAGCGGVNGFPTLGRTISMDQAQQSVQTFLDRTGDRDLKIDELMEFDQNYYALVQEKATGTGAFELLVNKSTGAVGFEPGPNMMWNTKYSMMGGMMGGGMMGGGMMGGGMMGGSFRTGSTTGPMSVAPDQATKIAQAWLDQSFAGDSAGTPDAFYGYYTFHFEKDGKIAGMLSVNGYGGQVWFHSWHGGFVQVRDFGA